MPAKITHPDTLVTLTPAPAWDLTYHVEALEPGAVNRAHTFSREFAGKGVNVTHNLGLVNLPSVAVVPVAKADRYELTGDTRLHLVEADSPVRRNITVIESGGRSTKINEEARAMSAAEWRALLEATAGAVERESASWVLISGRIPEIDGGGHGAIHELRSLLPHAVRIALDTSGPVLTSWLADGGIDLIKPNVSELGECVGRELTTLGEVVAAATEIQLGGVAQVLVSLGADGFVGVTHQDAVWATSGPVEVVNTIGAGDASVAGFFSEAMTSSNPFDACVRAAARWGAAKVMQATTRLTSLDRAPEVNTTRDIESSRPVTAD